MIKELKAAGLSQKSIAEKTGLSTQYISDIKRGVRGKRPTYDTTKLIVAIYNANTRRKK